MVMVSYAVLKVIARSTHETKVEGVFRIFCYWCSRTLFAGHGPLARYGKLRVAHTPGMPGMFFPPQRISDPDVHHGTCVMHVPWCMPESLTSGSIRSRCGGKNVPGIPGACATRNFKYLVRGPWETMIESYCIMFIHLFCLLVQRIV